MFSKFKKFIVPSVIISVIVAYTSAYNYASSFYQEEVLAFNTKIDRLEKQLDNKNSRFAWKKIPYLQNIHLPVEPKLTDPISIFSFWLSFSGLKDKEPSGDQIFRLQEIVQIRKDDLTGLYFENLILGPRVKFKNGVIEPDPYPFSPQYYLDFKDSNFQETHFINTLFSKLNLSNSNFYKSEFDDSLIIRSRLVNVNLGKTRLVGVNFLKSILINTNFKYSTLSNINFESVELLDSDFRSSTIMYSNFSNANLQGVDFSSATFIYRNEKDKLDSFKGALYNSQTITCAERMILSQEFDKSLIEYCKNKEEKSVDSCIEVLRRIGPSTLVTKASKFPKDFDPIKYGMIDIYKFIEFIKKTKMNELLVLNRIQGSGKFNCVEADKLTD